MYISQYVFGKKIKLLFLLIVYKILLELSYIYYISPTFGYEGFLYNLNWWKLIESYFFAFIVIMILPLDEKKPSTIALNAINVIMIVPILSIYALKNESMIYFYGVVFSFITTIFVVKLLPIISLKTKFSLNKLVYAILFGMGIVVYGTLIYFNGVPSLKLLNFNKVYEVRGTVNYGFYIMSYLVPWQGIIVNPFLMIVFLKNKKKLAFLFIVALQVMLYLITSHKTFFFYPIILPFLIYFIKRNNFVKLSIIGLISLIGCALLLLYTNVTKWIAALFLYRTLFLPAQISFQYYEYFSQNGFVLLSHSILKSLFSSPIYNIHPIRIIGQVYYINNYPNTGYLGDAYMNFGIGGMIVFSILFGVVLKAIDSLSNTNDKKLISGAFMVILMVSFSNAGLLTTLLTGGALFYMLVLWLYNEDNIQTVGNMHDLFSSKDKY